MHFRFNRLAWMVCVAWSLVAVIFQQPGFAQYGTEAQYDDDPYDIDNDGMRDTGPYETPPYSPPTQTYRTYPSYRNDIEYTYNDYMQCGYIFTEQKNYPLALNCFTAALSLRPDDSYALRAIDNVNRYIEAQQSQALEQQRQADEKERENSVRNLEWWISGINSVEQLQGMIHCIQSATNSQSQKNCTEGTWSFSADGRPEEAERNQRRLQILQARMDTVKQNSICSTLLRFVLSVAQECRTNH
ncbi:MAG: tetratricopeptide repeat protein [Pegethrix bostrychoides GSE-TBD4-15B]|uniref:Tetratricopeptide repeat protein n=1 Tax=Pegethrix bostrychoides GSE-TBD4-15B TaxID=2839662 RepID=A0A951PEZ0_9CYAN|nr:tetratricopeptide repeat protein [Pegethrix bostrychoides GSE-TBD4-15B]